MLSLLSTFVFVFVFVIVFVSVISDILELPAFLKIWHIMGLIGIFPFVIVFVFVFVSVCVIVIVIADVILFTMVHNMWGVT